MKFVEVVLDFEMASECDLIKCGSSRYAEDVTTEIICLRWWTSLDPTIRLWVPGDDPGELLALAADPKAIFIAFNAGFEKDIWRAIMVLVFGFPDIPNSHWHDIQATCAMKAIPQKMERAVMALRLPQEKDMEGSRLTKSLSKANKKGYYDRSPETLKRVYNYCGQDVLAEVGLHQRVGWLPPGERKVWLLDQRINERGVRLDRDYIAACRSVVDQATVPLAAEFQELTGGLTFTQRDKVLGWVRGQGVELPDMKKETLATLLDLKEEDDDDGEPEDTLAGDDADAGPNIELPGHVRRALGIRQLIGSASVKKLGRMEACVCFDGRARRLLQYHGAGPGRWAGRLLQPQNFPRGSLKVDDRAPPPEIVVDAIMTRDLGWIEMQLGAPPVESVVSGLRHALISSPGRMFTAGDFAQIEARVVLCLAGQWDKVAVFADKTQDIYNDMASQIYGRKIDRKHGDAEEGQIGKNSVLGLGFQMGWRKFKLRYGKGQPDEFFQGIVKTYREDWAPEVPKLWAALETAALRTVWDKTPHEAYGVRYELEDGWLTARLPSGRKLWYYDPRPTRKAMPWDDTDVRPSWTYSVWKNGQYRTIDAFGGLLTENVVQALARDIMKDAMFRAEENGFPIVLTVHDEIVGEPEEQRADKLALEQLMVYKSGWISELRIPVAAETWTGERYKK